MSLAKDLNNPGCLRGDDDWVGRIGTGPNGHARFRDLPSGVRALLVCLWKKERNGRTTLRRLYQSWATRDDTIGSIPGAELNDPDECVDRLGREMGMDPDEEFDLFDDRSGRIHASGVGTLLSVYRFIERIESGGDLIAPISELLLGASMFYRDWVENRS